jgi:hypothetical protein
MINKASMKTRRNRKRKTRRGGNWWNYGPSAEEFADEIIAKLFDENYPFTEKINTSYNLKKVIDKLIEKSNFVDENTRKRINARISQINAKIAELKRSVPSIHNMV